MPDTANGNLMGDGFFEDILSQFEKDIENIDVNLEDLESHSDGAESAALQDKDEVDDVAGDFAIPEINFRDIQIPASVDSRDHSGQGEYELAMANVSSPLQLSPAPAPAPAPARAPLASTPAFASDRGHSAASVPRSAASGSTTGTQLKPVPSAGESMRPRVRSPTPPRDPIPGLPPTPKFDEWLAIRGLYDLRDAIVSLGYLDQEQLRNITADEMRSIRVKPVVRRKLMDALDEVDRDFSERERQQQLQIAQMQLQMRRLEQQMFQSKQQEHAQHNEYDNQRGQQSQPSAASTEQNGNRDRGSLHSRDHSDPPPPGLGLRGHGGVPVSSLPQSATKPSRTAVNKVSAPPGILSPSQTLASKLRTNKKNTTDARTPPTRKSLMGVVDVFTRNLAQREQGAFVAATMDTARARSQNVDASHSLAVGTLYGGPGYYNENAASPHKQEPVGVGGVTVSARDRRHMANLGVARRANARAANISGMEHLAGINRRDTTDRTNLLDRSDSETTAKQHVQHDDTDTRALVSYQLRLHAYLHLKRRNAALVIQQAFRLHALCNPLSATFNCLLNAFASLVKDPSIVDSMKMLTPLLTQMLNRASTEGMGSEGKSSSSKPRDLRAAEEKDLALLKGTLLSQGVSGIVAEAAVRFTRVWLLTMAEQKALAARVAAETLAESQGPEAQIAAGKMAVPNLAACIRLHTSGKVAQANEALYTAMLAGEKAHQQVDEADNLRQKRRQDALHLAAARAVQPRQTMSPRRTSFGSARSGQSQQRRPSTSSSLQQDSDSNNQRNRDLRTNQATAVQQPNQPKDALDDTAPAAAGGLRKSTVRMSGQKPVWMPGGTTTPATFLSVGREMVQSYSHHNVVVVTPGKWQVETCAVAPSKTQPGASKEFVATQKKKEKQERRARRHNGPARGSVPRGGHGKSITGHVKKSRAHATPKNMYVQRISKWIDPATSSARQKQSSRPQEQSQVHSRVVKGSNRPNAVKPVSHPRPWGAGTPQSLDRHARNKAGGSEPVRKFVPSRLPKSQRPKRAAPAPGLPPPGYFSKIDAPFVPLTNDGEDGFGGGGFASDPAEAAFDDMRHGDLEELVALDQTRAEKAEHERRRNARRNPNSVDAWWPSSPQTKKQDRRSRNSTGTSAGINVSFDQSPLADFERAIRDVSLPETTFFSAEDSTVVEDEDIERTVSELEARGIGKSGNAVVRRFPLGLLVS